MAKDKVACLNDGWIYRNLVPPEAAGLTVLQFYTSRYGHSTESEWRCRLENGQVQVDQRIATPAMTLAPGQVLCYHRRPWHEPDVPDHITVLHDDPFLLAVDKPSGLPTMPGGNYLHNTLLHRVRARYGQDLAPLHRLGRATSGVVVFARCVTARRALSADMRQGRIRRLYRGLVDGADIPPVMTIDVPVGLVDYPPLGKLHAATAHQGKCALSLILLLERRHKEDRALVQVELVTGRSHQIRIHLAAAGHPLSGDPLYGVGGRPRPHVAGAEPALPGHGGFHLHAERVELQHPGTHQRLVLVAPPPPLLRRMDEAKDHG